MMNTRNLKLSVLIAVSGILCLGEHVVMGARQTAQSLDGTISKTVTCDYLLYLPKDYGKNDKPWPVMMFLHGAGERGSNLNLLKKHGPPKLVEQGKDLPFIVVSPQCPSGQWWTELLDTLTALLDEVETAYNVDRSRVYLTGLSMGGFGTWSLACHQAERFAAIAPICGGGPWYLADRLKDTPVWAFHGAQDGVVPLRLSEEMVGAIKRTGGDAKLTVYPEANHDSWTVTYDNPELYQWFLRHSRKP